MYSCDKLFLHSQKVFIPPLLCNSGNKHQNNPLTETVHHSSLYISLYIATEEKRYPIPHASSRATRCLLWIFWKQGKSEGFDSCDRPSNLKLDSNRQFFCPCDREIWWMTLQNNRAPLLCYFKLCASFCTHRRLLKRSRHFGIPIENEAERVSAVTSAAAEWRTVVAARRISLW